MSLLELTSQNEHGADDVVRIVAVGGQTEGAMKRALITGITGQDGSYLTELLLGKGYEVHGIKRRASQLGTQRIDHLYTDPHEDGPTLQLHYGDLTESSGLIRLIGSIQPHEVYNLGAQSHVAVSFEQPEYTADVNALGALRILEAIRVLGLGDSVRYYQASTSELFGGSTQAPQSEVTPFHPRSPYAISKLFAYWTTVNYRESYGMYACNGILFNHESPRRGETFVTRKITQGLARVALGLQDCVYLGNLDSRRDWGHARDYVALQWAMLQKDEPRDYVVATGIQSSVRDVVRWTCEGLGVTIQFEGEGAAEVGRAIEVDSDRFPGIRPGQSIVCVDPRYYRPAEVYSLVGDARLARDELGWLPTIGAKEVISEMLSSDLQLARQCQWFERAQVDGHDGWRF